MNYEEFVKEVEALPEIMDVDGIECPNCGEKLEWMDGWLDETYHDDRFEMTETFMCYDCGNEYKVIQVYAPTERRVEFEEGDHDRVQ